MAKIVLGLFFAVACIAGRIDGCFAQSNFYEGKTMRIIVGFSPGGGYVIGSGVL
jgi:hypothetical protein